MSAQAIRYYLSQDVTDGSAATVAANNPTLWASSAVVPDYAYKSLGTIWLGAPTLSSTLGNKIVYRFGSNDTDVADISLFTQPIDSALFDRVKDNEIAAEETNLVVRLTIPQDSRLSTINNFLILQNAELRIRYLLDTNWRRKRRGTPPIVPSLGDPSLDPTYGIYVTFDGYIVPPNAEQIQVRYRVYYHRAIPASP